MSSHYRMFAAYNTWANRLVYDAAATLSDEEYRRDLGAFFRSVHETLNHVLFADRLWLARFAGENPAPGALDTILYDDFAGLRAAREQTDADIVAFIGGLGDAVEGTFSYKRGNPPQLYTDRYAITLSHFFNHQTHHRGQIHMMLTVLDRPSLALDLIYFLRTDEGKPFAQAAA
ncbi:DinB family protein [Martelella endophytica]|uniref:Diguanylate cyclase n=1 Tax=Martelella endophytica TaxID=1486262 RepID=A0A0D5LW47_MAREN|nr:DinB family protein [Martelella endophytica]AJY48256.1 diguanylate cyclase [Martelella endophytica]